MYYVFGYGSLIHIPVSELGRHVCYARLHTGSLTLSLRRAWNAHLCCRHTGHQYTALGLEWVPPAAARPVNGRIFTCTDQELEALQKREVGYDMIHLPAAQFEVLGLLAQPLDATVFSFMPRYPRQPTAEYPINANYVKRCIDACAVVSPEFAAEFIRETTPVLEQMPLTEPNSTETNPPPTIPGSGP